MVTLIYTGGGHGGALLGVPARDLTEEEAKKYGGREYLIATGLYKTVLDKAAFPKRETKAAPKE